ncbi:MAG: methyl viologen-reducing hydrogenase [Desulfobacterales bacterium]
MTAKVASDWLNSCSGCEIAVVDLGERLLTVLDLVEFVHIPALMDHKYYGQMGDGQHLTFPEADLGIISGGIKNEEHLEVAREMRRKCGAVIAIGTCATHGGIPALANSWTTRELMDRYYSTETTDACDGFPHEGLPPVLDRVYALDEKIDVDIYLPGCPPHPDQVFAALTAFLEGKTPELPTKSVCDTCPAIREGKGKVGELRRFFRAPQYKSADEPLDQMRCLLEQGLLCMGPVTRAGCGGDGVVPRCISARVPCRGCYGPVHQNGNQRMDMLNALASNGISVASLPESVSMLRFSGGHGMLKPARR